MKIVDQKGRLFGKINVIDFLVVLILLCTLPAFYFGYKIMTKKPELEVVEKPKKEFVQIEIDCQFTKLEPELLEVISVGDKELDKNGEVIGEIISLGRITPYRYEFEIGEGQKIIKEEPSLRQIEARLKLKPEVREGQLYYKDKPIKLNSPLEFKTDRYSIFAIIPKAIIPKERIEEGLLSALDIDCLFVKIEPEVANLISVGDKELDKNGEVIGEIISLGRITPYRYEFEIGEGQKIIKEEPSLRQIEARLKLKPEVREGQLYYKDKPIKLNSPLEFKTNNFTVSAIAISVEDIKPGQELFEIAEKEVYLDVILKELDEETLKRVSVGDKEVDVSDRTIAEIVNLGKIERSAFELDLGGGSFVKAEETDKKQIVTKMRLRCLTKDGEQLYFKGRRVQQNQRLKFCMAEYGVEGIVAKTFEKISPIKKRWTSLQVKFNGIYPEIANVIQKGDIEKDLFDETIARINSILSNQSSSVVVLKEDKLVLLNHPSNRDIVASLDVQCVEKEGVYYFKNYPVKIGNNITFTADLYSVSGLIVGLEIK